MELKLQKADHEYYETLRFAPFPCETMRENIVPDSCGDIARIVDTTGTVCLTGRELTGDGRFCASGSVEASVLYIPEKEEGLRSLHFQIPFQCYGEGQGDGACEDLDIRGELRSIDTRVLNPRKVLTRANLVLYPAMSRHVSLSVATGVAGDGGEGVQMLREQKQTRVAAGVREKEFSFSEELPLSPGRGGAEEILSTRVDVRGTDSKLIGSKLVVKGFLSVSVLYRETGGRLGFLSDSGGRRLRRGGRERGGLPPAEPGLPGGQRERPGRRLRHDPVRVSLCPGDGVEADGYRIYRRPLQHRRCGLLPDGGTGAGRGQPAERPAAERPGAFGDRLRRPLGD